MKSDLRKKRNHIIIHLFLTGLSIVLLFGNAVGSTEDYDVQLSWFIDMEQFDSSAHGDLFCINCHGSISEQNLHPDPANVTREASEFFHKDSCSGTDCHENTLQSFEKGIHGRIQFENREKYANCIDCHDPHSVQISGEKTAPAKEKTGRALCKSEASRGDKPGECKIDEDCLECHSLPTDKAGAIERESTLCFNCHSQMGKVAKNPDFSHMPIIDATAYHTTEHTGNRCTDCHTESATYGHKKTIKDCEQCHAPHDEGKAHDAHVGVDCKACHLQGSAAVNQAADSITWQPEWPRPKPVKVHHLIDVEDEQSCIRCHTSGNQMGAAAMVLPAKSVICMSCHTATLSAADVTSLITVIVSFLIFLGLLTLWLSAGPVTDRDVGKSVKLRQVIRGMLAVVFSRRIVDIMKAILLDAIVQRRLFVQSKYRWFSHGLIFYPFLLRFGWGLVSLLMSLVFPDWELTAALLDKNHPLVAFLFDFTGVLIVLGVVLVVAGKIAGKKKRWPGLPRQEWLSHCLIGSIIIVGFVLEGLRIAMTLDLAEKQFAFLGYAISLMFTNARGLTDVYGYVWYLHAILTGAFIIWLPFSRMFHIVMGPVAIAVNAVRNENH